MVYDNERVRGDNQKLEGKLIKDRELWKNRITNLVDRIKNISELSDCQVNMLSYRQILLDKISEFKITIYKKNSTWDKYYKNKWIEYTTNYNIKLNNDKKNSFITSDLSELKIQIKLLESHVEYYYECIKTLDNMAFAIKNRITLEDTQ